MILSLKKPKSKEISKFLETLVRELPHKSTFSCYPDPWDESLFSCHRGPGDDQNHNAFYCTKGTFEKGREATVIKEDAYCWTGIYFYATWKFGRHLVNEVYEVVYWCPKGHIIYEGDRHLPYSSGESWITIEKECVECS